MTSTTSYNNYVPDDNIYSNSTPLKNPAHSPAKQMMNIFWLTVKRNLTLMIVYSVVLMLNAPMFLLLNAYSETMYPAESFFTTTETAEATKVFAAGMYGSIFTAAAIVFAIIAGAINFSYMHNKRTIDTYYSLPVSRTSMLFGRYLGTLFVLIVPALAGSALCAATTLTFVASIVIIRFTLMLIIGIVAIVSFMMLLSVCCGTTGDTIISFIIINIVYPILILIAQIFPVTPLSGYADASISYNGTVICALSPAISPYLGMWSYDLYNKFTLKSIIHIVWFLIFIAACIFVSRLLVKARKSEMAQNSFAFALPKVIIITITSLLCGLILGWVFANLGYTNAYLQYFWFWVGALIGSSGALTVLYALYHRGFKGFPKALILYASLLVVSAAAFLCLINGWFGYEGVVPDSQKVKSVKVDISDTIAYALWEDIYDYSSNTATFDDEKSINQILQIHKSIIDENKHTPRYIITPPLHDYDNYEYNYSKLYDSELYGEITIEYTLKNGSKIKRCYTVPDDSLEQSAELIENFINSDEYAKKTNPVYSADPDTVNKIDVTIISNPDDAYSYSTSTGLYGDDLESIQIRKEIARAVKKDITQDDNPYKTEPPYSTKDFVYIINLTYGETNNTFWNTYSDQNYGTCYVKTSYKNTISVLEKYGLNEPLLFDIYDKENIGNDSQRYDMEKTGKYIYFEAPSDWEGKQIYASFSEYNDYSLWSIKDPDSKCEHVKDNLWRIETVKGTLKDQYRDIYEDFNVTFSNVFFYEYDSRNERYNVTAEGIYSEGDKIYKTQTKDDQKYLISEDYKSN